ncbi:phosphatidylinositol-glycan biosynthesis class F protein isoform X3 [Morus notabilis]|uniref:phosphatidylinositol-glycan biosynthesis class F protein isoform X3 n=1 Tax=Morus notabilis TaxID=981085 RepID=UPI000CED78C5|nr:phosphatidylinositol-glycan biosynthesis class F protein isoform X3 [Morus notabilis]
MSMYWSLENLLFQCETSKKKKKKTSMKHKRQGRPAGLEAPLALVSAAEAFIVHLICAVGLAVSLWVAHNLLFNSLISHPSQTLFLIWVIECPVVILLYSHYRQNRQQSSYLRAVGRGMLTLLAGALVVPAASVFGSSWTDWQRLFACTKPVGTVDYMICLPAHGAIIGSWFGAWPMPLDWERPWQEWPICVSFGAIAGYLIGMVASFGFVLVRGILQHTKSD